MFQKGELTVVASGRRFASHRQSCWINPSENVTMKDYKVMSSSSGVELLARHTCEASPASCAHPRHRTHGIYMLYFDGTLQAGSKRITSTNPERKRWRGTLTERFRAFAFHQDTNSRFGA
jgi:hypothetical protein